LSTASSRASRHPRLALSAARGAGDAIERIITDLEAGDHAGAESPARNAVTAMPEVYARILAVHVADDVAQITLPPVARDPV
jgi:hypothetical protein